MKLKKLHISLTLIVAVFGMVSCESLGLTAPAMDTEDAFKRIVESYEKNIDTNEYHPVELRWFETDKLSNELSYLNVTMISKEDNKTYTVSIKVGGDNQGAGSIEPSKSSRFNKYTFDKTNWIRPSDINPTLHVKQVESAINQFSDEYSEYTVKSIADFLIQLKNKTEEIETTFTVRVTKKGEATQRQGNRIVTNFYEQDFYGLPDGTAEMKD